MNTRKISLAARTLFGTGENEISASARVVGRKNNHRHSPFFSTQVTAFDRWSG